MVFSSLVFLFLFLPLTIIIYYILPKYFKNGFLLAASLFFFSWAGVSYSILIFLSITANFFIGKLLNRPKKKRYLVLGIVFNLSMLIVFKYTNFIIANLNGILSFLSLKPVKQTHILLPIGISFYTFQAMSYLIDVYYGRTQIQKRIDHLGLYISLFPQLIAGPIVRYHEIKEQLQQRKHSIELFSNGIKRFIIGLSKKVLLANTFAVIADGIFQTPIHYLDTLTTWIGIIVYAMQIYYDFSGYSDMAVGLGKMFGFNIPENFNFPYISASIREFWRRWHITLSNWFRDYLYIPLGGNRKGKLRTSINLIIVFVITGFWHGASWNFLIWGLIHGCFLLIERTGFNNLLIKSGKIIRHLYTLLVVLFAWVYFRSDDLSYAYLYTKCMIGIEYLHPHTGIPYITKFITTKNIIFFIIGIATSTPLFKVISVRISGLTLINNKLKPILSFEYIRIFFLLSMLILCIMELAVGTYNPFIYFRF